MPKASQGRAFFLVGPTASGKTAVAQSLAERRGAEILSADSMLVYKGMDIGTAKPSAGERERVRYWGVDVVTPAESYNVARFLDEARRCFEAAAADRKEVIVVGGTGLYIKALLTGLEELPSATPEARDRWQGVFDQEGIEGLRCALERRAPAWLSALPESDRTNGRRLIRALELVEAGVGEPPRSWTAGKPVRVVTGLTLAREELVARIESRVRAMYEGGLLDEVQALLDKGWSPVCTAAQAIGYAEAIACVRGQLTRAEAMRLTAQRTRQLAKRQMTWFRHQATVSWIEVSPGMTVEEVSARVVADWDRHGPQPVAL
jgi:tRNA dimethylallyltransferase